LLILGRLERACLPRAGVAAPSALGILADFLRFGNHGVLNSAARGEPQNGQNLGMKYTANAQKMKLSGMPIRRKSV